MRLFFFCKTSMTAKNYQLKYIVLFPPRFGVPSGPARGRQVLEAQALVFAVLEGVDVAGVLHLQRRQLPVQRVHHLRRESWRASAAQPPVADSGRACDRHISYGILPHNQNVVE